jgi:hypothetical protein
MKTAQYRKGSFESRIDELLPEYPSYAVIAHELWRDDGGWSVNDSWHISRSCDREDAICHLRNRWEVFKVNYAPRARVRDIEDVNWCGPEFPSLLEVDCIAFAEVHNAS